MESIGMGSLFIEMKSETRWTSCLKYICNLPTQMPKVAGQKMKHEYRE